MTRGSGAPSRRGLRAARRRALREPGGRSRLARRRRPQLARSPRTASVLVGSALLAGALVAGCTRSESLTSVTSPPGSDATATSTTSSTSTTTSTTTPAEVSTTTTSTTTSTTTTTTSTTTTTTTTPPAPATVFTLDGRDLVERDAVSGAVTRRIVRDFVGEAVFPVEFELTSNRSRLYYAEFVEDGWYSCDTSPGFVNVVDVASGARSYVDSGSSPVASPNGRLLAYLSTGTCLPDPAAPGSWVLTPYDRVVVVDVVTGERYVHGAPTAPTGLADPNALAWVGFENDDSLIVTTATGAVHRVPARRPTTPQSTPLLFALDGLTPVDLFGNRMYALRAGTEGSSDLYAVDTSTGAATEIVRSERALLVAVSAAGRLVIATGDPSAPAPEILVPEPIVVLRIALGGGDIEW